MKATFEYAIRKLTDYVTRVRKPARYLMISGLAVLIPSGAWTILPFTRLVWSGDGQMLEVNADQPSQALTVLMIVIGLPLLLSGAVWEYLDQRKEQAQKDRQVAIVIESRGLRDDDGRSLKEAATADHKGRLDEVLIDLRRFSRDGNVVDPEGAADEVMQSYRDLQRRRTFKDRHDISLVYGGLTPVPFTFLIGVLTDDQGAFKTWDWDRTRQSWRKLDAEDDGRRFKMSWTPPVEKPEEVVLAVSASYPILDENLERSFPGVPVMRLDLEDRGQDSHWSEAKQAALATQFLSALKSLEAIGVKTVRLVIAAQNSMVFRLGTRFERRNVPKAVIYQFERNSDPPFPWGVRLPDPGTHMATIERTVLQPVRSGSA